MTQSSGIFTFPSTGTYFIDYSAMFSVNGSDNCLISIEATTNNSSFAEVCRSFYGVGQSQIGSAHCNTLLNVSNTTNVKVRFSTGSLDSGTVLMGETSKTETGFIFIRLGDST